MLKTLLIFTIASVASSFSGTVVSVSRQKGLERNRNFVHELSAIPKRKAKQNLFQVRATAFLNGDTKRDKPDSAQSTLDKALDSEALSLELLRQKLEFEALLEQHGQRLDLLKSSSTVNGIGDNNTIEIVSESIKTPVKEEPSSQFTIPTISPVWQARLLLLVSAALYGTNFTFVKMLNECVPVQVGTAMRFSLAALVTLPMMFQQSSKEDTTLDLTSQSQSDSSFTDAYVQSDFGNLQIENFDTAAVSAGAILGGIEVGFWNSIGYLSQAVGLETTPASTSAFVCSLAVVVVPILDYLSGKKLLTRQTIGALFAVAGVGFLELDGFSASGVADMASGGPVLSSGDLFTLVQPLAFGIGFWRMEHYMRKFPTGAMKMTGSQLSTVAVSSIACFLATSGLGELPELSQFMQWMTDPSIMFAVAWTGLITTALTVYMETLALKTLSAAETTMLFSTEPIFGGICASAMLGESFGVGGLAGAAMVLSGCLYSNMGIVKKDEEDLI